MSIAVIKYNAGNIRSVQIALDRLGVSSVVTDDPDIIRSAEKVIFPGVGEASSAMKYLKERKLDELILSLKQPVLGICLGLQLMCSYTEEANTSCLGIFDNRVIRFPEKNKVPHIGWNSISGLKGPLFKDIADNSHVYFVHSYAAEPGEAQIAGTNYIIPFASALRKDNFYATQFHPEKSGDIGQQILKNFIEL
ncbi:MAG: imidazole glycerol phosphate synthase subunit HisH [Candidatus Marinimicrobia bacterium]|nr:imidazole glycerol phosphate synthase subunit HisH [Candidatus Neomarinimicrobiota bacterium]